MKGEKLPEDTDVDAFQRRASEFRRDQADFFRRTTMEIC